MRGVAIGLVSVALAGASAALAAPERSTAYQGWRYGPISGTATLTTSAPRLVCFRNDQNETRVIRGTYRSSFTGTSMRRTRAAADIGYNLAAGGPAGNTEPIAIRMRRTIAEVVHVKTVTINDLGDPVCTLEERQCSTSDTKIYRRASNRLNVWMRPRGRVEIYPPLALAYGTCAPDATGANLLFGGDAHREVFPLAVFNRPRSVLRFASTNRIYRHVPGGPVVAATLVYRASIGLVRMPGTPLARCKVC
ncbi:MAG TPA: hypothetical protein VFL41_05450 [Gaiellaceae bacterium]|nr:hypothetical protein [Gaiellaceae bacterium]